MKYFIYSIASMIMFILPIHIDAAESEALLLAEYEVDVTGDGQVEDIKLYGVLFSPDAKFYKDIYATITSKENEWRINYPGGYDPVLEFIDLNHDDVPDIFYQSPTGGSGGLYNSQLDTLARGKLQTIALPKQEYVKGYFAQDFQAVIEIFPNEKPIVMNVERRKDDYIRLGIYDENGNLLRETTLMVDPIAFYEPVQISKSKGYGLKSYKQISGAYHADGLGVLETLWYYEDGKWIILKTEWKETNS